MTNIDSDFLKSIWKEAKGFVRVGALKDKQWEQEYLPWPDIDAVRAFYAKYEGKGWDLYYNPTIYATADKSQPLGGYFVWIDVDGKKPHLDSTPRYVVQTSGPLNLHVYWELDALHSPEHVATKNRHLAYKFDADKSGWDFGQMLRVPGTQNFKHGEPQEVKLVESNTVESLVLDVKQLEQTISDEEISFSIISSPEYLQSRIESIDQYLTEGNFVPGTRSSALFHVASSCRESGLDDNETATVLWAAEKLYIKKFRGKWNEDRLVKADIARLLAKTKDKSLPYFGGLIDPLVAKVQLDAETFWQARPELAHVQKFARSKLAPPWGVFGCVLARVIASTEPNLVLPPVIGGEVSLNLFVALVGRSSGGKGISNKVAKDCVKWPVHIEVTGPGSGEGLTRIYKELVKDGDDWVEKTHTTRALLQTEEIDTLSALVNRQAATLMPELRKAYMGETLGFSYADRTKRIKLREHEYRLCLTVGVQPLRAEQLFSEADGGTPQRFLWMPTDDPFAPDVEPLTPAPLDWTVPGLVNEVAQVNKVQSEMKANPLFAGLDLGSVGPQRVELASDIERIIKDNRRTALRGEVANIDGHALLTQEKVATALALLAGRTNVNMEDWQLAEIVMAVSNATRASIMQEHMKVRVEKNQQRAQAEAKREIVIEQAKDSEARKAAAKGIKRWLEKTDDWMSGSDLRRSLKAGPTRDAFEDAIEELLRVGQIEVEHFEYRKKPASRYRLAG